jgi:hypothetical protein
MLGTKDGKIEKMVMATEDKKGDKRKTCKECHHQCHCDGDLHADEYGVCTCGECKCQ